jgi:hypothetical protein
MKTYVAVEVQHHAFLPSALYGGECQLHSSAALLSGKEFPVIMGYEAKWTPEPLN